MLADKTTAFIGGGSMAEALIRGLVDKADIESERVWVSGPRKARIDALGERYKIRSETDNKKLAAWAQTVMGSASSCSRPTATRDSSRTW